MATTPRKRRTSSPEAKPRRSRPGYDPRSVRDLTRGAAALHLYLAATRGTASRIARLLDVTEMTVSFWHRGKRVPAPKMRVALAKLTRGAVAVEAWDTTDGAAELAACARHIESEREAAECAMQTGGAS